MSDEGERLGDDLFPDSPEGQAPPPVASGSRSPSPARRSASRSASPTNHSSPAKSAGDDAGGDLEGDLFGDDDEPAGEAGSPRADRDRSSSATPASRRSGSPNPLEYEEDDVAQEESYTANLILPDPPRMSATDGKIWHLKLPAYMNIESTPYDADYFHEMAKGEEEIDSKKEPLLAKQKILRVKNTIRWKWGTGLSGDPEPQSNARMVRWSDGSMSLQLGTDLFDVAPSIGTTLARPEDLEKQGEQPTNGHTASQDAGSSASTFLMIPAQNERVLTTEAPIAGQLSLVPTSSNSKTHMELVKHVGQQHVKHSRMKILDDLTDPAVNELLAKASGRDNKPVKPKTKRAGGSGSGRRSSRRMADSDSDEERRFATRKSGINYDSDDDGFIVDDEDEEEEAEATEDEDDMAYGSSKKSKSKSKSKKRKGDDEDDGLDEMEEAERRIEQKERERKRAKRESKQKKSRDYVDTDDEEDAVGEPDEGEAEMDMDVESEED